MIQLVAINDRLPLTSKPTLYIYVHVYIHFDLHDKHVLEMSDVKMAPGACYTCTAGTAMCNMASELGLTGAV